MLDTKQLLVTFSGLNHDAGKLFERGEIFADARKDEAYLQYCPLSPDRSHHTHLHSAHTRAFCDWLEERFDCLRHAQYPWKDWSAAHHRFDESGLENTVIRRADQLSSKERESGQFYIRDVHRKTLLEPIVERVFLQGNADSLSTKWRYPLRPLSAYQEDLFPGYGPDMGLSVQESADQGFSDPKQWTHLLASKPLIQEYAALGHGLLDELDGVAAKHPYLPLEDLVTTLHSLLEKYTANVPSATNVRHPDISLFDHLRTTAAIAQSLYLHQTETKDGTTKDIGRETDVKFILACGDFSGIQKFIFNLTNEGAAKGLRGRSFYVQFFCKACADFILKRLGLHKVALLYNSGGKFYLLIPKHLQDALEKARSEVNAWLMSEFHGQVFMGLGVAEITDSMFTQGRMDTAWKMTAEALERDRLHKFKDQLSHEFFQPQVHGDPSKSCRVCGNRDGGGGDRCPMCKSLESLGIWLRHARAILTLWGEGQEVHRMQKLLGIEQVLHFERLGMHTLFIDQDHLHRLQEVKGVQAECTFLNPEEDFELGAVSLPACATTQMYLGKWESSGAEDLDFEAMADQEKAISRLGVLRMDVDNLGLVFIQGLQFPERDDTGWGPVQTDGQGRIKRRSMASISRMVTLSRQLNMFFSGYVPRILKDEAYSRCRIIYAGGDDLFIVGAWDQLPGLARSIRDDFSTFCCRNPDFSISGGLTLHRGKFPIYKAAVQAGDAESRAKKVRQEWGKQAFAHQKDGFCFINVPIVWEDMPAAVKIKDLLESQIQGKEGKGFISFLGGVTAKNRAKARNVSLTEGLGQAQAWEKVAFDAWRWRTAYQLKRRYPKKEDEETRKQWAELLFASIYDGHTASLPVYTWLEFPIRWADYLHR
jgi:CRISPR-associated protein Csm1